jgi:hypothetical protein
MWFFSIFYDVWKVSIWWFFNFSLLRVFIFPYTLLYILFFLYYVLYDHYVYTKRILLNTIILCRKVSIWCFLCCNTHFERGCKGTRRRGRVGGAWMCVFLNVLYFRRCGWGKGKEHDTWAPPHRLLSSNPIFLCSSDQIWNRTTLFLKQTWNCPNPKKWDRTIPSPSSQN